MIEPKVYPFVPIIIITFFYNFVNIKFEVFFEFINVLHKKLYFLLYHIYVNLST